ncbi:unnamed protein product [Protopolystoma xenopodis]|uniref:Uncharacterized protein n=1 Tax=Protopolystoma xenopodis TaxID=117903 RepID=A0A3S5BBJ8_9PLAT|nr:unnamed protein product [Protopolystoma xenopodis]
MESSKQVSVLEPPVSSDYWPAQMSNEHGWESPSKNAALNSLEKCTSFPSEEAEQLPNLNFGSKLAQFYNAPRSKFFIGVVGGADDHFRYNFAGNVKRLVSCFCKGLNLWMHATVSDSFVMLSACIV